MIVKKLQSFMVEGKKDIKMGQPQVTDSFIVIM